MTDAQAITVIREMLANVARIAAPILLLSMLVGLVISLIQAATQVHEQTITFVPKLILIILVLFFAGPWMLQTLVDFTTGIFEMMLY